MNTLVRQCGFLFCLILLGSYAFAKAEHVNTINNITSASQQSYTITASMSRVELLDLFKVLETEHKIKTKLTAYSRNGDRLERLGLSLTDKNGVTMSWEDQGPGAIPDACIVIDNDTVVKFENCNQPGADNRVAAAVNSQAVVQSSVQTVAETEKVITSRTTVKQDLANKVVEDKVVTSKAEDKVTKSRTENAVAVSQTINEEEVEEARIVRNEKVGKSKDTNRIDQAIDRKKQQLAGLKKQQEQEVAESKQLKAEQIETRSKLKELVKENKAKERERKKLRNSTAREKQRRDTLEAQQSRLQAKLESQQLLLLKSQREKDSLQQLMQQQQKVIQEQGLAAETARALKAYRTALKEDDEDLEVLSSGYLVFAGDQYQYKVYDGYSIVYSALGRLMFTMDQELSNRSLQGKVIVDGKPFNYIYKDEVLVIRDNDGIAVDKNGLPLSTQNDFENSNSNGLNQYKVGNNTSIEELKTIQQDINAAGIDFEINQQIRNGSGNLNGLVLRTGNKLTTYQDATGNLNLQINVNPQKNTVTVYELQ